MRLDTSRREFLATSAAALAALWINADPRDIQASLAHAFRAKLGQEWETFTPEEAADVEAIAAQIIPTTDTPGAREAKVVNFIDHSLAHWASRQKADFIKGLEELNAEIAKRWRGAGRFAALDARRQEKILKDWDKKNKPFFEQVRSATITGMFSLPEYGGNADQIGWKLLGYEHRPAWQPPFGSYDSPASE